MFRKLFDTPEDYLLAFLISGLACLLASLLVLRIARPRSVVAPA